MCVCVLFILAEGDWEAAHLSSLLNLHSESREIAGHHHASAVNMTSLPSAVPDTAGSTSKSDIDNVCVMCVCVCVCVRVCVCVCMHVRTC